MSSIIPKIFLQNFFIKLTHSYKNVPKGWCKSQKTFSQIAPKISNNISKNVKKRAQILQKWQENPLKLSQIFPSNNPNSWQIKGNYLPPSIPCQIPLKFTNYLPKLVWKYLKMSGLISPLHFNYNTLPKFPKNAWKFPITLPTCPNKFYKFPKWQKMAKKKKDFKANFPKTSNETLQNNNKKYLPNFHEIYETVQANSPNIQTCSLKFHKN